MVCSPARGSRMVLVYVFSRGLNHHEIGQMSSTSFFLRWVLKRMLLPLKNAQASDTLGGKQLLKLFGLYALKEMARAH